MSACVSFLKRTFFFFYKLCLDRDSAEKQTKQKNQQLIGVYSA